MTNKNKRAAMSEHPRDLGKDAVYELISPIDLRSKLPISVKSEKFVKKIRSEIAEIIHGRDDRMLCIVGPCSIHDVEMAVDYAERLKTISREFKDDLLVVMRVYFEKPRTAIGWKGLINDPDLNGTFSINKGLNTARQLLLTLLEKEVAGGTEWLDVMTPSYLEDLICWGAVGARTSESQVHRQLVSSLKMPVGFKNSTSGDAKVAANSILSASSSHTYMGISSQGVASILKSKGNPDCHTILRGGHSGPNFDKASIQKVIQDIKSKKIDPYLIVDCSHGNSGKDYTKQQCVCESVAEQVREGNKSIVGVMIESHIKEGNQKLCVNDLSKLEYGKSITDSCVNIDTTQDMLRTLSDAVKKRRESARSSQEFRTLSDAS